MTHKEELIQLSKLPTKCYIETENDVQLVKNLIEYETCRAWCATVDDDWNLAVTIMDMTMGHYQTIINFYEQHLRVHL